MNYIYHITDTHFKLTLMKTVQFLYCMLTFSIIVLEYQCEHILYVSVEG